MDGLDQPCQIKHREGWRPGRGRYREEGQMQINAQSQKSTHGYKKLSSRELQSCPFVIRGSIVMSRWTQVTKPLGLWVIILISDLIQHWSSAEWDKSLYCAKTERLFSHWADEIVHCAVHRQCVVMEWLPWTASNTNTLRRASRPECEAVIQHFSLARA